MKKEINLLPKKIIKKRERHACFAGITRFMQRLAVLLVLLIIGEIFVYSSLKYFSNEAKQTKTDVQGSNNIKKVEEINRTLGVITEKRKKTIVWSLYLEELTKSAPKGIEIKEINTTEKENEMIMQIQGFSDSHDSVLNFQSVLEKLSWVTRLEAPLQNFALGTDKGFTYDLIIQTKGEE